MFFVDAGNDGVSIGSSTDAPAGALEIATADGTGAIALVVTHLEDTNDAIDIVADAVTTAKQAFSLRGRSFDKVGDAV